MTPPCLIRGSRAGAGCKSLFVLLAASVLCAQNLAAAPGGVDDGLRVWLRASNGISVADGEEVLVWADSSTNENDAVYNPGNIYGELPPVFDAANPGANGQPSVRFNNQNALELDLSWLAGSDYTLFVVNARDRFGVANFYIAGDTFAQDQSLVIGYENESLLRFSHLIRDLDVGVEPYSGVPIWSVDVFRFSSEFGKEIYRDSVVYGTSFQFEPLISNTGTTLGHFRAFGTQFWFEGDIAEVIVYDRKLTLDEQFQIEAELADRYDRPLQSRDYESNWTASPPTIDGSANDPEWIEVDPIPILIGTVALGSLRFLNDDEFLYVLVDVTFDTFDDPEVSPLNGDYFNFLFDVNENAAIDSDVDLNFTLFNDRTELCRQFFREPNLLSGCFGSESEMGWQFASSSDEPLPHHVVEFAFDLDEISAAAGEVIRSAFTVRSNTPFFTFAAPPNPHSTFADFFDISLASGPVELIMADGFEVMGSE